MEQKKAGTLGCGQCVRASDAQRFSRSRLSLRQTRVDDRGRDHRGGNESLTSPVLAPAWSHQATPPLKVQLRNLRASSCPHSLARFLRRPARSLFTRQHRIPSATNAPQSFTLKMPAQTEKSQLKRGRVCAEPRGTARRRNQALTDELIAISR
jgi:hypothetical protein